MAGFLNGRIIDRTAARNNPGDQGNPPQNGPAGGPGPQNNGHQIIEPVEIYRHGAGFNGQTEFGKSQRNRPQGAGIHPRKGPEPERHNQPRIKTSPGDLRTPAGPNTERSLVLEHSSHLAI